jgi:hypothetical protein
VSVDEERPDEAVTDAQGAVTSEEAPPPWGDDFDPARAWKTITHLRDREKELESSHKTLRQLEDDEEARIEWLKQHGYEIEADEEPVPGEDFEDDEPEDSRLKEYEQQLKQHQEWIQRQEAERAMQAFQKDLEQMTPEGVELDEDDRQIILDRALKHKDGWNRDTTQEALTWLLGRYEKRESAAIERLKGSKRAPHVSSGGKAGKGPQPDLDTEAGRAAYYADRLGQQP